MAKSKPLRVVAGAYPAPPGHLTKEAKDWWQRIVREYGIGDEAGLLLLEAGLTSFDRANAARLILEKEGLVVKDRYEQYRPHPAAGVERDARKCMLAFFRELNL